MARTRTIENGKIADRLEQTQEQIALWEFTPGFEKRKLTLDEYANMCIKKWRSVKWQLGGAHLSGCVCRCRQMARKIIYDKKVERGIIKVEVLDPDATPGEEQVEEEWEEPPGREGLARGIEVVVDDPRVKNPGAMCEYFRVGAEHSFATLHKNMAKYFNLDPTK